MAALLLRIERASNGEVKICRSAADIRHCIDNGILATILHIEGAEGIDPDLYMLDVLYESGLRSIGRSGAAPTSSATACRSAIRPRPIPAPASPSGVSSW